MRGRCPPGCFPATIRNRMRRGRSSSTAGRAHEPKACVRLPSSTPWACPPSPCPTATTPRSALRPPPATDSATPSGSTSTPPSTTPCRRARRTSSSSAGPWAERSPCRRLRGRNRRRVTSLVLDGPVVDWVNVLDGQAKKNLLPTPIAKLTLEMITQPWARPITGLQTPLDLDRMDWVTRAAELDVPVLLIHSDDDEFVPSGPSHALASVRRDLVTMPDYSKAHHTKE